MSIDCPVRSLLYSSQHPDHGEKDNDAADDEADKQIIERVHYGVHGHAHGQVYFQEIVLGLH